jgi:hypothetical protein
MSKRWHLVTNIHTGETTTEEIPDGVDPTEFMQRRMDDCALCKIARERGELPVIQHGPLPTIPRPKRWAQPMRWRKRKRSGA